MDKCKCAWCWVKENSYGFCYLCMTIRQGFHWMKVSNVESYWVCKLHGNEVEDAQVNGRL